MNNQQSAKFKCPNNCKTDVDTPFFYPQSVYDPQSESESLGVLAYPSGDPSNRFEDGTTGVPISIIKTINASHELPHCIVCLDEVEAIQEPTKAEQIKAAKKLLRDKGYDALNNPHAMIGRTCRCGNCFCCAAVQVLEEYNETVEGRARRILLRFVKKDQTIYIIIRKQSRTNFRKYVTLLVVSDGRIEDITSLAVRFTNHTMRDDCLVTNEPKEFVTYLAIQLFKDHKALSSTIIR